MTISPSFFYLKMKGDLENHITSLSFKSVNILRPGPLKGEREEFRMKELVSNKILSLFPQSFLSHSLRPVEAIKVSELALKAGLNAQPGVHILGPEQIHT